MNGTLHRTWANFDGFILQGRRLFGRNWLTECLSHYYELDTSIWRVFLWGRCWWRRWGCDEILLSWLIGEPTVTIWKFTFHKKSGFVRVILKANFNSTYRPNPSLFWAGNSDLLYSFLFYFFAEFIQSTASYTLMLLFQRVYTYMNCNFITMQILWDRSCQYDVLFVVNKWFMFTLFSMKKAFLFSNKICQLRPQNYESDFSSCFFHKIK